ncbi:hypothetical protein C2S53_004669 [Perilla frutescens var. hirtella]|uniref:DUF7769 domain-containing protein n=1 Tax=Perilla frutescens var. hirtella TaxID=608512 RepID=A0AAD4JIY2_PERFH|nr:hypothetical protein C2S53_004669 [Perilla frutescens var. hirtella]
MRKLNSAESQENQVLEFLLECSTDEKIPNGKINEAAAKFQVCRKSISQVWAAAKKQAENNQQMHIEEKTKFTRTKRVAIDLEKISKLPLKKRSIIRTLAHGINYKKSTVGRWIRQGLIKAHTSAIMPDLRASNKLLRLRFSLETLELDRILNILKFRSMHKMVHIDEKWFYMKKETHRFYMTPEEAEPHRSCKSNKFIAKIMFMCAVCRPLFATDGTVLFDGKIGVFPFTHKVPAQRSSKNRSRGILETKAIESVTKEVIKNCLINQILPAIKEKWPPFASKVIYIQQDNAKPHIKDSDLIFREASNTDGFEFTLVQQPPNSPNLNVNDLGWFRSIQSLQTEIETHTVDELVNAVITSFENLYPTKLNKVFLTLQCCLVEIMKVKGHNCYKIPHMGKDALIRVDSLPLNLEVPVELVRQCLSHLMEAGSVHGIQELMNTLGVKRLEGN